MWWLAACRPAPEVDCELAADNALRVRCEAAEEVEITLSAPGEPPVAASGVGELPIWRLAPDTAYTWTASAGGAEVTGEVRTGDLPPEAALHVEREGEPPTDDVMFLVDCGEPDAQRPTAVVLDPDGRVVWYQEMASDLPIGPHPMVGLTWSEDHTVLAALDRGRLREFSLAGELLLDLESDRVVHHDVFRRDGRTFTLTAHLQEREGTTYIVDGVDAYDPDGSLVFRWDLSEVAEPAGSGGIGAIYWAPMFAGAADWAHANGIHVAEDGDFVLSLHSFSAVVRFTGDPEDPAFGAPEWVLDGGGGSPWPSTFAVVDPAGRTADDTYGHQHHPTLVGDGDLQIFDNGDEPSGEARGLRLALDEEAGTAEIVGSWPIPAICPIEGAVFAQSDGTLLLTCALRSTFYAVDPATAEILGSTTATCADRPTDLAVLPRAIPVDLR